MNENDDEKLVKKYLDLYVKRKSFRSIVDLIDQINNQLLKNQNFNRNKIERILKKFIKDGYIYVGSKLTKDDILADSTRSRIYKFICKNPGILVEKIKIKLNYHNTRIIWHLDILEKFKYIRITIFNRQKSLYKYNQSKNYDEMCHYYQNDKVKALILLLKDNLHLTISQIAQISSFHYVTIKKYIKILLNLNLIHEEKSKNKCYQVNFEIFDELMDLINK